MTSTCERLFFNSDFKISSKLEPPFQILSTPAPYPEIHTLCRFYYNTHAKFIHPNYLNAYVRVEISLLRTSSRTQAVNWDYCYLTFSTLTHNCDFTRKTIPTFELLNKYPVEILIRNVGFYLYIYPNMSALYENYILSKTLGKISSGTAWDRRFQLIEFITSLWFDYGKQRSVSNMNIFLYKMSQKKEIEEKTPQHIQTYTYSPTQTTLLFSPNTQTHTWLPLNYKTTLTHWNSGFIQTE